MKIQNSVSGDVTRQRRWRRRKRRWLRVCAVLLHSAGHPGREAGYFTRFVCSAQERKESEEVEWAGEAGTRGETASRSPGTRPSIQASIYTYQSVSQPAGQNKCPVNHRSSHSDSQTV